MGKSFVCEPIEPIIETMDSRRMARGEPGLPRRFRWRGAEHEIAEVLEQWRETGPCKSGSDEEYVRKHWYRIRTTAGVEMRLYFERQPRSARERKARWWLHSMIEVEEKD
ncbi:MAG: cytoplasmic protein [Planctomycetes bacterium]|nr:cytoplasmic protein [Planctomycetota bacterium]